VAEQEAGIIHDEPTVHILATVRNPALRPAALLVFKTLRTAFPNLLIKVYGNALAGASNEQVADAATSVEALYVRMPPQAHDEWIQRLIETETQPFLICDTDMVFWRDMEGLLFPPETMSGRFEPEFHEEWTNSIHAERLHTCLMYLNPAGLRARMAHYLTQHVPSVFPRASVEFIRQHFVPRLGQPPLFYDSMAGAWHAFQGEPFGELQNSAFDHLSCGTYVDVIGQTEGLRDLGAFHAAVYDNLALAHGLRVKQQEWYEERGRGPLWWQRSVARLANESEPQELVTGGGGASVPASRLFCSPPGSSVASPHQSQSKE
jgi:hypothetical protein